MDTSESRLHKQVDSVRWSDKTEAWLRHDDTKMYRRDAEAFKLAEYRRQNQDSRYYQLTAHN